MVKQAQTGFNGVKWGNNSNYDGLHMHGPAGKKVFHESVIDILCNAGICKSSPIRKERLSSQHLHSQTQSYDPLKIFRERLSSLRGTRRSSPSGSSSTSKPREPPKQRSSVITSSSLQSSYSVPVSNTFSALGN